MTLSPGTRVGPYEITSHIGSGGMGEVYRARDTRLKRDVAIKVLPAFVAAHPDRVARFQREAEMLAALNHPNIAHIHGLEDSNGVSALVMEFIDGPTLADRIVESPRGLPTPEIVAIATQIASALESAHDRGIVHRDLKPANIKIAPGGVVKLLDFGLAKEFATANPDSIANTIPDTMPRTQLGAIVGTAAYMSPEQALGEPVDARADLFSLGAVLYEMATGRPAFDGAVLPAILDKVIHKTPASPRSITPRVPPALDRLILLLLEKDRDRRPQRASEVADELRKLEPSVDRSRADVGSRRRTLIGVSVISFAALAALTAAVWFWSGPARTSLPQAAEYVQITGFSNSATSPSFSPDGKMMTFIQGGSPFFGPGEIFVKALPDGEPIQLTNDRVMKMAPVFSPDGLRIAYTAVTPPALWDTWVVPALGGTPQLWMRNTAALSWTGPKQIMFSEIIDGIHMRVVSSTEDLANKREVFTPSSELGMAHLSSLSPDGKSILVVEMNKGSWLPCRVVPFDASSTGRQAGPNAPCTSAAWSRDGRWIYVTSSANGAFHIWRQAFPNGVPEQITAGPSEEEGLAIAPDGQSLLTSLGNGQQGLWLHDSQGERIVSREGFAAIPQLPGALVQPFSSDGHALFYMSRHGTGTAEDSGSDLWMTHLDTGRGEAVLAGFNVRSFDVSRDVSQVVVAVRDNHGESHIWVARLDKGLPPRQVWAGQGDSPRFGPHGDIYFRATENATHHAFIYRITNDGGEPQRVSDSPVLFLMSVSPDGSWVIASLPPEALAAPVPVIAIRSGGGTPVSLCDRCQVDWMPDGRAMVIRTEVSPRTMILPLEGGAMLPRVPPNGWISADAINAAAASTIEGWVYPRGNAQEYVSERGTIQRNIYRIPLK